MSKRLGTSRWGNFGVLVVVLLSLFLSGLALAKAPGGTARPFEASVSDGVLHNLKSRLAETRWPDQAEVRQQRAGVVPARDVVRDAALLLPYPQTLAYALNDSPAGLASWIIEKFRAWSDPNGNLEHAFSKDELLTNLTIYWATQTINPSMRLYYETARAPDAPRCPRVRS